MLTALITWATVSEEKYISSSNHDLETNLIWPASMLSIHSKRSWQHITIVSNWMLTIIINHVTNFQLRKSYCHPISMKFPLNVLWNPRAMTTEQETNYCIVFPDLMDERIFFHPSLEVCMYRFSSFSMISTTHQSERFTIITRTC